MTQGRVNVDRSFIFAWTILLNPLDKEAQTCSLTFSMSEILEGQIDGVRYWRFKVVSCSTVCWKGWAWVWRRYAVVWSDNTLKWDGSMLIAKPNSTDSEKNEDWRNGCLTAPRVLHLCLGKGVRGRKRAVYLLRCVPMLGNCATTILKTGCWASWTTWTREWCFSKISGAPPPR